ncbi:MAG: hypothetical protein RIS64_1121 [Bacteroidota bacterium]|jgi:hypothetical protein
MLKTILSQIVTILRGQYGMPFFIVLIVLSIYLLPKLITLAIVLGIAFLGFKYLESQKK